MIFAIDPGISTGMALRFDNGNWGTFTLDGQGQDFWNFNLKLILQEIQQRKPDIVVCERFVGVNRFDANKIETTEVVGAIRGICLLLDIICVRQLPSDRYTRVPMAQDMLRERKRETGIAYTDHEASALAHLLTYEGRLAKGLIDKEGNKIAVR